MALFGAISKAHASGSFVFGYPDDRPLLRSSNQTLYPGSSANWSQSTNADAGQVVAVTFYYHNIGSTATNTTFRISSGQSMAANTTQVISGNLSADGTGPYYGNTTINLSSAQTLTYMGGSVVWNAINNWPSSTPTAASLPFGQNGSELFTTGLNIGSVLDPNTCPSSNTWCHQGSIVLWFQVGNTVINTQPQCVINSFNAIPVAILSGASSSLIWSTTNCTNASISNIGTVPINNMAGQSVSPPVTATYTLTAYNATSSATPQSTTITVAPAQQQQCIITSFAANPNNVSYGSASTLSWATSNCTNVSISNIGSVALAGSQSTGPIYGTNTYTLSAYGSNGNPSQTAVVTASQQQQQQQPFCTINAFSISPNPVNQYSSATIYYQTSNCTNVSISPYVGSVNNSGSGSVSTGSISNSTTFTIIASNGYNAAPPQSATVSVYQNNNYNNNYYPYNNNYNSCTITSFTASPSSSISSGGNANLYWNTSNCNSVSITGGNLSNNTYSSTGSALTGALYGNTTFTLTAYGYGNNPQTQTTVYVNNTPYYQNTVSSQNTPPSVISTIASSTSTTASRINGLLVLSNNLPTTGWFEWGTTQNLGNTTAAENLGTGSNVAFYDTITGLSPDTFYYYRAVAENGGGTTDGTINEFKTLTVSNTVLSDNGNSTPTTNTVYVTKVISGTGTGSSLVSLKAENRYDNLCPGDTLDDTITYANASNKTLTDAVLRITLPKDVAYKQSSTGTWSDSDDTLTVDVGTLVPGQNAEVFVSGTLHETTNNTLVTTASLAFSDGSTQQDATGYAISNTGGCANKGGLAGFALGSGSNFFPQTMLGWIILLAAIIVGTMVVRDIYGKSKRSVPVAAH